MGLEVNLICDEHARFSFLPAQEANELVQEGSQHTCLKDDMRMREKVAPTRGPVVSDACEKDARKVARTRISLPVQGARVSLPYGCLETCFIRKTGYWMHNAKGKGHVTLTVISLHILMLHVSFL